MPARAAIDALDRSLERAGTDIVLRRKAGAPANRVNQDATVRATVRNTPLKEEDLVPTAGTAQVQWFVTISPTPIMAQQWPGGAGSAEVPTLPVKGDKLVINGDERNIEVVDPIRIDNVVVRFNLLALG